MRFALVSLLVLAVCASFSSEGEAQAAEQAAATAIARVHPGIGVPPVANCVRDHAPPDEIAALANHAHGALDGDTRALNLRIIDRPETDACIRANGIILDSRLGATRNG